MTASDKIVTAMDIWTKIEDLNKTELNALAVYDEKYIKNQNKNI